MNFREKTKIIPILKSILKNEKFEKQKWTADLLFTKQA